MVIWADSGVSGVVATIIDCQSKVPLLLKQACEDVALGAVRSLLDFPVQLLVVCPADVGFAAVVGEVHAIRQAYFPFTCAGVAECGNGVHGGPFCNYSWLSLRLQPPTVVDQVGGAVGQNQQNDDGIHVRNFCYVILPVIPSWAAKDTRRIVFYPSRHPSPSVNNDQINQ